MNDISAESKAELVKRYRTTSIIVLAEIAVTLILIVTGWLSAADSEIASSVGGFLPLWIVVIFIAVSSFILRRMLNNWERLKAISLTKGIAGALATLQLNSLMLNTLALIIGIIGFYVASVNKVESDVFRAGAVALIVFLMNFPRKTVWKNITANLEKYKRV